MAIKIQNTTVITDDRELTNIESLNGITTGVVTPSITSPSDGATDQNKTVTITSSAFADGLIEDTHASSDWELATDSDFNTIVQSNIANTANKTSWTTGDLDVSTTYYVRVRHNGTNTGASNNSGTVSFATRTTFAPTGGIGSSYEGGFYTGTINVAGVGCYFLIVAPNATGCACCRWKNTRSRTFPGPSSCTNGYLNTYNSLANADHPGGNWAATRTIDGFSDWYMPARDELNVMYVNRASMPAGEQYCTGPGYMSSTESNYFSNQFDHFCKQNFNTGNIYTRAKYYQDRFRVIRREPF